MLYVLIINITVSASAAGKSNSQMSFYSMSLSFQRLDEIDIHESHLS